MSAVWAKLNLKDQTDIVVLDAPDSFAAQFAALGGVRVHRRLSEVEELSFLLAFAVRKIELDRLAATAVRKASADPLLWFAYPKGSSKKFQCDFNRDSGWDVLRKSGFDSVRQVAIDEEWSALRFRRVDFIQPRAAR